MIHALPVRMSFLACLLGLAACARDDTSYPSLGLRPVEKMSFGEPSVKPAVAQPDPALDAQIATMAKTLDTVTSGFARDAATADRLAQAARRGSVGSEVWLDAQTALAGLDDWRAQTSSLLTDIEERATDRAAKLEPDYPALQTLRDRVEAEGDRQGETITRIQALLPGA